MEDHSAPDSRLHPASALAIVSEELLPVRNGVTAKSGNLLPRLPLDVHVLAPEPDDGRWGGSSAGRMLGLFAALLRGGLVVRPGLRIGEVIPRVEAYLASNTPAFVHLDTVATAHLARPVRQCLARHGLGDCPIVLSANDSYSLLVEDTSPVRTRALRRLQLWHVTRAERRAYRDVDVVDVVSPVDAEAVAALGTGAAVRVLPLGRPQVIEQPLWTQGRDIDLLLFAGESAFAAVLESVVPTVRRRCPNATIAVVGTAAPALQDGLRTWGVEGLGFVDDLHEVMACSSVVLAPSQQRSGTSNKARDAMASGAAVVGGRCLHGIPGFQDQVHGAAETTSEHQAARIVDYLEDPTRRVTIAQAGHELVSGLRPWGQIASEYVASLPQAVRS